jgi:hypothetical protein
MKNIKYRGIEFVLDVCDLAFDISLGEIPAWHSKLILVDSFARNMPANP